MNMAGQNDHPKEEVNKQENQNDENIESLRKFKDSDKVSNIDHPEIKIETFTEEERKQHHEGEHKESILNLNRHIGESKGILEENDKIEPEKV
jgi:hypothetical protein